MKRAAIAIVSTVASLVMLLSFKTHATSAPASPPAAVSSTSNSGAASGSATAGRKSGKTTAKSSRSTSGSKTSTSGSTAVARTYTGDVAQTLYGPIQVQVTVSNGLVTKATAIEYPSSDPRDAQINAYAIPALNSEAQAASSATIDMVSGATYTSQGYLTSLQSALDKAGL